MDRQFKQGVKCHLLDDGFNYNSKNNPDFLDTDAIRDLIKEHLQIDL